MNLVGTHVPVCLFNFGARPGWKRPRGRLGPLGKSSKRTTFGSKWLSIDQLSSISIFSIIFSTQYFIRKSSKRTTFVSEWISNALTKYLVVRCPTRLSSSWQWWPHKQGAALAIAVAKFNVFSTIFFIKLYLLYMPLSEKKVWVQIFILILQNKPLLFDSVACSHLDELCWDRGSHADFEDLMLRLKSKLIFNLNMNYILKLCMRFSIPTQQANSAAPHKSKGLFWEGKILF